MPTPRNVQFFETPAQLRAWFEANHDTADELWLGYHSKHTGRPSVTWQDVVDQELCFGWIDSVRYSLGDGMSAQRITPRRKRSVWSEVNIRRYQDLERQGLVHPRGRAAFAALDPARSGIYSFENPRRHSMTRSSRHFKSTKTRGRSSSRRRPRIDGRQRIGS